MTSCYDEVMKTKHYLPFRMDYLTEAMVVKAEKELHETAETKSKAIPELRKLIESESQLVCLTDDAYLVQFLRARKYNVKRAFALLQSYYEVKKSYRELYDIAHIEALRKVYLTKTLACLPYRDEDGCIIYIIKMSNWNPEDICIKDILLGMTTMIMFCIEDVATQINGVKILVDVKDATFKQFKCITPKYFNLLSRALKNCLPCRFKGIHIYNESIIFSYIWSVLKLLLSEKIKNRVHFHGDNQKHLHKFIPKSILPSEYGGDNTQFSSNLWFYHEVEQFYAKYEELTTYGYRD